MNDDGTTTIAQRTLEEALLDMNRQTAREVLVAARQSPECGETFEKLMMSVLGSIGARWDAGELALSQVYMSGRVCAELMDELLPDCPTTAADKPVVAICTFQDQHVLGKRIILSTLRASGIAIRDYGGGLGIEEIVERSRADGIRILLVSVLMLRSALKVKDLVEALRTAGLTIQVVAGGAPFRLDPHLKNEVGAAITGDGAAEAVSIVRTLLGGHQ